MSDPNRSNEMFYKDDKGKRQDSDLHEEMFQDGAEEETSRAVYEDALAEGMDPELADVLYGSAQYGLRAAVPLFWNSVAY